VPPNIRPIENITNAENLQLDVKMSVVQFWQFRMTRMNNKKILRTILHSQIKRKPSHNKIRIKQWSWGSSCYFWTNCIFSVGRAKHALIFRRYVNATQLLFYSTKVYTWKAYDNYKARAGQVSCPQLRNDSAISGKNWNFSPKSRPCPESKLKQSQLTVSFAS